MHRFSKEMQDNMKKMQRVLCSIAVKMYEEVDDKDEVTSFSEEMAKLTMRLSEKYRIYLENCPPRFDAKGKSMITGTDHDLYTLTYEQRELFIDNLCKVVVNSPKRTITGNFHGSIAPLVFATDYQKREAYRLTIEDQSDVL